MADPTLYAVSYSFAGFQASAPTTPLPGSSLDNELAGIETSIESVIDAIQDIRRSDGGLKNGIVTVDSMSVGVIAALLALDQDATAALDTQIALIQTNLNTDLAAGLADRAAAVHTHAATDVTVSAISGITGTVLQAVLAELRALGPQAGDFMLSLNSTTRSGWVPCNDGTIGDATSGATTRANADTLALYTVLWDEVSNTYAPVTTGRGVSAAADFAAHKPIALTKMLGRALAVAGTGSGLSARTLGQTVGAETHTLTLLEAPSHSHGGGNHLHTVVSLANGTNASGEGTTRKTNVIDGTFNTSSSGTIIITQGNDQPHNNVQPTSFLHAFLKL